VFHSNIRQIPRDDVAILISIDQSTVANFWFINPIITYIGYLVQENTALYATFSVSDMDQAKNRLINIIVVFTYQVPDAGCLNHK
jgi:hypothetical protein